MVGEAKQMTTIAIPASPFLVMYHLCVSVYLACYFFCFFFVSATQYRMRVFYRR